MSEVIFSFLHTGNNAPTPSITFTEHDRSISHGNSIELVFLFTLNLVRTGIFTRSNIFNESSFKSLYTSLLQFRYKPLLRCNVSPERRQRSFMTEVICSNFGIILVFVALLIYVLIL